ncbi:MAG: aspartate dehydrogenase domain-containing protein [Candidatus Heimdallarchaeaceae archaeon]
MVQKLCIIGLGYIGSEIIKNLDQFENKIELTAVFDIEKKKMEGVKEEHTSVRLMTSTTDFDDCDIVIEAATQQVVKGIFNEIVKKEKIFIPMSIGAFITDEKIYSNYMTLEKSKQQLIKFPSGAIGGFDAINSIKTIGIISAKLTTTKPPFVFREQRYIKENNIILSDKEKTQVFNGNAKEAARAFPKSINVGARLALATLGPEETTVEVYSDPLTKKNTHEIEIHSEVGVYRFSFQNNPSPTNPKTSWLAALSIFDLLENRICID